MPEPLLVIENPSYRLRLWLSDDQMECRADLDIIAKVPDVSSEDVADEKGAPGDKLRLTEDGVSDIAPSETLTPAKLIQFLTQCDITQAIDFESLYNFCAAGVKGIDQQAVQLAAGIEPVGGTDGWFELEVKTSTESPEYKEDEKGNVDLRTLNAFTEIEIGQKLGTVHPPKEGTAGTTANGLPIPAESGKPFELIAGEGIELKYDGRIAFAERTGRVLLDKQTLTIVDEIVIPGDLNLKTGNIDFNGFVEIKGDVPDDFSITASKGIKIGGTIGACRIESGGSMEIGSMAGKEVGQIICHGDLKANYLNQATVLCYGNVFVANEIRNSLVKATGQIVVERGSIIGGKCVSLEGIEAKVLGTTSGQQTLLVAGVYFPDADRFDYLGKRMEEIDNQLKLIHSALGPLDQSLKLELALANASNLRLSILNQKWEKLEQEKELCLTELEASCPQTFSSCNPKINVLSSIKEGVVVCLGGETETFKTKISGPLSLVENTMDGGLRQLTMSALEKLASLIEEDLLAEQGGAPVAPGEDVVD